MLCSLCNAVSKSPEDSRLSEHHPSFLEVVGDFTDTSFRVHFHSFYDVSCHQLLLFSQPIRSLLVAGVAGGFQTLDFSMPFVFATALIDLWRFSTAWYGTVRHGSVRYGTAQFGSVCVSTAV